MYAPRTSDQTDSLLTLANRNFAVAVLAQVGSLAGMQREPFAFEQQVSVAQMNPVPQSASKVHAVLQDSSLVQKPDNVGVLKQ